MRLGKQRQLRNCARGFSLVTAIFVLVVLAALGAFMVTIGEAQRAIAVGAAQGARAYQAANAGIEWGVYRVLNNPPGTNCAAAPATTTTGPFTLTAPALGGFQVRVSCSYTTQQERGNTYQVFSVTSLASFGTFGSPDYFSRSMVVAVTNATGP